MRVGGVGREEWEAIKARGRRRYVLMNGIFARGLPLALILMIVFIFLEGRPLDAQLFKDGMLWLRFLGAAALFSIGGVATFYARWRAMEIRYDGSDADS